jgi:hypothetical protein
VIKHGISINLDNEIEVNKMIQNDFISKFHVKGPTCPVEKENKTYSIPLV